jgi:response regulator RpfG family c-di-GMP phosphodiesterase
MTKKKVLIVDDQPVLRHFCTIIIDNYFDDVEIVECCNGRDAIEEVQKHHHFDLIISDYEMVGGDGHVLLDFLDSINYEHPYILHTSRNLVELPHMREMMANSPVRKYLQKPSRVPEFNRLIAELVEGTNAIVEYKRVKIVYFLRFNKVLCDVYIKLGSDKFVKIINKDHIYTKEDIDKYIKKNQKHLYILQQDFDKFTSEYITTPFLEFIQDMDAKFSPEDSLVRIHAVLEDLVHSVGIDKVVLTLANEYVSSVDKIASDDKKLGKLLFKMRSTEGYLYDHSYMTACMASFILNKLSWGSQEHIEKVCQAAIFHDIALSEQEHALITDIDGEHAKLLDRVAQRKVKLHGQDAADLLKNTPAYSSDLENILQTHHELPNGKGFPKGFGSKQIGPLACVFILAHEFVKQLYLVNFDESAHKDILVHLFNNYNSGNFKDAFDALHSTLKLNSVQSRDA